MNFSSSAPLGCGYNPVIVADHDNSYLHTQSIYCCRLRSSLLADGKLLKVLSLVSLFGPMQMCILKQKSCKMFLFNELGSCSRLSPYFVIIRTHLGRHA